MFELLIELNEMKRSLEETNDLPEQIDLSCYEQFHLMENLHQINGHISQRRSKEIFIEKFNSYLYVCFIKPKFEHKSFRSSNDELYLKLEKGFQTKSHSCTNKINRWIYQGLQSSLLDQIIQLLTLIINTDSDLSSIFLNIEVISLNKPFEYGSSNKQEYANPLAKCSLFKLYLQIMDHLLSSTITYAQAKALSTNSLRNQYQLDHSQWIRTDPNIFYLFTLQSS